MSRDEALYLADILRACSKIQRYLGGRSRKEFFSDERTYDAVLRNLQIIGEAAKRISAATRQSASSIDWRKIAGFRDIVVHEYFGIDHTILWDIVTNKVPELEKAVRSITRGEEGQSRTAG